jgi:hypothetical protein
MTMHDAAAGIQAIRVCICMARKRARPRRLHEESSQRAAAESARLPPTALGPIVSGSASTSEDNHGDMRRRGRRQRAVRP